MVKSLKQAWGVEYIYAWHGLPAYWAGVAVGESCHLCQAATSGSLLAPASLCHHCATLSVLHISAGQLSIQVLPGPLLTGCLSMLDLSCVLLRAACTIANECS